MSEKQDRRVKYTKMVLRESLIACLQEKPISRITIKELCERADINRATFYSHYQDQYDLLKKNEQEVIDEINLCLDRYPYHESEDAIYEMVLVILTYVKENSSLCKVLFGSEGNIDFQRKIMDVVYKRCIVEDKSVLAIDACTAEYIYTYATIGVIGVIQKWLRADMAQPVEQMAKIIVRLANGSAQSFMRL